MYCMLSTVISKASVYCNINERKRQERGFDSRKLIPLIDSQNIIKCKFQISSGFGYESTLLFQYKNEGKCEDFEESRRAKKHYLSSNALKYNVFRKQKRPNVTSQLNQIALKYVDHSCFYTNQIPNKLLFGI